MSRKPIAWRAHFIELLVVIIGISIAFALDGWSERKKDKQLEINYLNSLKSDLSRDRQDMLNVIDSTNTIIGHIGEAFQLIYSGANSKQYRTHHITSAYTASYFYPNNGTYISLVNSGSLNVITDFEVKSKLADLYNVNYRELERVDNVIRKLVDDMIYPFMITNIEFGKQRGVLNDASALKSNEAINMLGSYFNFLRTRKSTYQATLKNIEELIETIDKHKSE